jgi:guanylate kinase
MSYTGLLLIISGPAGVGKTTIAHAVEQRFDAQFSISMTTRGQTAQETDGVDYHFVQIQRFEQLRDQGALLEWAQVFDNYYGTPKQPVLDALAAGKLMIVEIDVQGAEQVKKHMPDAYAIFIEPPSEQALLERLRGRRRDDEAAIQKRYAEARKEIARAKSGSVYDEFVVNNVLETAIKETIGLVEKKLSEPSRE